MPAITLYTAPDCHYCAAAREYFSARKLAYTEHDVSADHEKWTEMIETSHQLGVPVVIIGANVIVGFNRRKVEAALSSNKVKT